MPTNYQYRYVELLKESSYGTAAALSLMGEVDDESVSHQFDLMTRADMSYLGAKKSLAGKTYSEGGINLVCQPDDFCAMIMRGIFNSYTFDTGVSHVMTEDMDSTTGLPSFTLKIGREEKEHLYTGMCISRVSMAANVGEYVTMSADFTGRGEGALATLDSSPTFAGGTDDGYHFAGAEVFFDDGSGSAPAAAGVDVKAFSLEWNLNLNTDNAYTLGSRTCVTQPSPQLREITGSLEFARPVITASNDEPTYAAAGLTAAGLIYDPATAARKAIQLKLTSGSKIVTIDIHKCIWESPTLNVSGRDSSTMSLNFTALVDADDVMSKVTWTTGSTQTLA